MPESNIHKKLKAQAAGSRGNTEVPIPGNERLDATTSKKATEIERSGKKSGLEKAARRLQKSGKPQKVLQVPQKNMNEAAIAMRNIGVSGTVKNISGTKRKYVPRKK